MSQKRRQTVVIIGASFAGLQVAHGLLKGVPDRVKVVLINPSDKWYFNIAGPRIFGKPKAFNTDQYLLPIPSSFAKYPRGSFEFIKGRATNIDTASKTVTISSPGTTQVPYDRLVIASGSSTDSLTQGTYIPFKPTGEDNLESSILDAQKEISKARSIIIGGAGPIGVEFAGELAEAWAGRSGTSITLVSGTAHVLPILKTNASRAAEKLLAKHNIKLITGRKVTEAVQQNEGEKQWTVSLDNGEKLKADVYVSSTGVTPNNEFIPPEFLSSDGWVIVDEQFRVGQQPIYALGDITVHPIRTSIKVMDQVPVVVANLKADILGSGKRSKYNANEKVVMMVPVGASSGTGQMMGMVVWGKMVAMVKGKDFFVSKAPGMVGLA